MKTNKLSTAFIKGVKEVIAKGESLWQRTAGTFFTACEFSTVDEIKTFLDDADARVLEWVETLDPDQGKKVRSSWKTSYLGVFRACQKMRTSGKADNLSAFTRDGKPLSIHACREILGTGTKAKTTPTTTTPKGNTDAVNPASNPPMAKVPTVKSVDQLYDALLPSFEMARGTILTFAKGKTKMTNVQGLALAALSEALDSAFKALADLIE